MSPDLEAMMASLAVLKRQHDKEAREASTELGRLMVSVSKEERPRGRKRRISIMLEEWQVRAAKLLAIMQGGSYQERIRLYVELGLRADARLGRSSSAVGLARRPRVR